MSLKIQILSYLHWEFPIGEFDGREIRTRSFMENTSADVCIVAEDLQIKVGRNLSLH